MKTEGHFQDYSLQEIVQMISINRGTGRLSIQNEKNRGQILFHEGQVIYARSSRKHQQLGGILIKKGYLTSEKLDEALKIQKKSKEPLLLGMILQKRSWITFNTREETLRHQIQESFFDILGWSTGQYIFYEQAIPERDVKLRVEELLMEAMLRLEEEATSDDDTDEIPLDEAIQREIKHQSSSTSTNEVSSEFSLREVLELLRKDEHIKIAAFIARDGSVYSASADNADIVFTVGAMASNTWGMMLSFGEELLNHQNLKAAYLHFNDDLISLYFVSEETALLIVGDNNVNLKKIQKTLAQYHQNILTHIEKHHY